MPHQTQQIINQQINNINHKIATKQYEDINKIKNSIIDEIEIDDKC